MTPARRNVNEGSELAAMLALTSFDASNLLEVKGSATYRHATPASVDTTSESRCTKP